MNSFQAKAQVGINKSVVDVFSAIVNYEQMTNYFISSASANMTEGATITWTWSDVNAEGTVYVETIIPNSKIVFYWPATSPNRKVELSFQELENGATKVSAVESGDWGLNIASIEAACQQTGGWMHMLLCLKAYLEHGINLRKGSVIMG